MFRYEPCPSRLNGRKVGEILQVMRLRAFKRPVSTAEDYQLICHCILDRAVGKAGMNPSHVLLSLTVTEEG